MRQIIFRSGMLAIAAFIGCMTWQTPALAQNGGYAGVLPPASSETADDHDSGGYDGVLAPVPKKGRQKQEAPAGYSGVVPGNVPEDTKKTAEPAATVKPKPAITMAPGRESMTAPATSPETLKLLSMREAWNKKRERKGTENAVVRSNGKEKLSRIQNMAPMEYMVDKKIQRLLQPVADKKLSAAQRSANAKKAYEELLRLAEGLRHQKAVPDSVYQKIGLSDSYIQDKKVTTQNALDRLDTALQMLKKYQ